MTTGARVFLGELITEMPLEGFVWILVMYYYLLSWLFFFQYITFQDSFIESNLVYNGNLKYFDVKISFLN